MDTERRQRILARIEGKRLDLHTLALAPDAPTWPIPVEVRAQPEPPPKPERRELRPAGISRNSRENVDRADAVVRVAATVEAHGSVDAYCAAVARLMVPAMTANGVKGVLRRRKVDFKVIGRV